MRICDRCGDGEGETWSYTVWINGDDQLPSEYWGTDIKMDLCGKCALYLRRCFEKLVEGFCKTRRDK